MRASCLLYILTLYYSNAYKSNNKEVSRAAGAKLRLMNGLIFGHKSVWPTICDLSFDSCVLGLGWASLAFPATDPVPWTRILIPLQRNYLRVVGIHSRSRRWSLSLPKESNSRKRRMPLWDTGFLLPVMLALLTLSDERWSSFFCQSVLPLACPFLVLLILTYK